MEDELQRPASAAVAGGVALQTLGEIADQFLRLRRIVEFPGLCFGANRGSDAILMTKDQDGWNL